MVVWDIGANVGFFTLLAARLSGPTGKVIAFEPMPDNQKFLRQHASINGLKTITLLEVALGSQSEIVRFSKGSNASMHKRDAAGCTMVQVDRIDDLIKSGLARPNFIKIDVEGAESEVLNGAITTLMAVRPIIYSELHGPEQSRTCKELLRQAGYSIFPTGRQGEWIQDLLALPMGTNREELTIHQFSSANAESTNS